MLAHEFDFAEAAEEGAADVDVGELPVEVWGDVVEGDEAGVPAGVVDGDVESAPEGADVGEELVELVEVGEVGLVEYDLGCVGSELVGEALGGVGVGAEMDEDAVAVVGEGAGDADADALGGAGDRGASW